MLDLLGRSRQNRRVTNRGDAEPRDRDATVGRHRGAREDLLHEGGFFAGGVALVLGAALLLASCAAIQRPFGGWFGTTTATPSPTLEAAAAAPAPSVYYAGIDGLKMYSEPSASSKIVATLSLHEKVTRTKLERGYAYVESASGRAKGWVDNARLVWQLPKPGTTAEPPPEGVPAEEPAAAPEEEPKSEAAPEPTATATVPEPTAPLEATLPAAATPTPRGAAPSIFNPF